MRLFCSLSFVLLILAGLGCTKDEDLDLSVYFTGTVDGLTTSYEQSLRNNNLRLNSSQTNGVTFYEQKNQIGTFLPTARTGVEISMHFNTRPTAAVIAALEGQTFGFEVGEYPFAQVRLYTAGIEGESSAGVPQAGNSFFTIDEVRPLTGYNPGVAAPEAFGDAFLVTGSTRFRTATTTDVFASFAFMLISYR